ncbi:hypothetical protein [Phaffia rhodozyma]|uniref:Uncharacterized protein n=1 Tax=Phaffia rhodozyma TaxID=264483 RepID=A0A0F7SLG2_PHARH|nr:hypothetical protein [Phaffia rhodozyma]
MPLPIHDLSTADFNKRLTLVYHPGGLVCNLSVVKVKNSDRDRFELGLGTVGRPDAQT